MKLMEKKDFDSFERLGKQLDALVNNLGNLTRPSKVVSQSNYSSRKDEDNNFQQQLSNFFVSGKSISLESERCDIASFDSIRKWIDSKLPIKNAINAHIFKTSIEQDIMLCIFFSDEDCNALLENNYPMKRIICNKYDSDIEVFLNGLTIGTIKL